MSETDGQGAGREPVNEGGSRPAEVMQLGVPRRASTEAAELARKADDFDSIRKALEDAGSFTRTMWITFVSLGTYLAIAAGSITHRQLFLETPINLPLLNIALPLVWFFIIAPIFYMVMHYYLLLQLRWLAYKAMRFNERLDALSQSQDTKVKIRAQLPNFVFVQALSGAFTTEGWAIRWSLFVILWLTMVITPLILLLLIQYKFLPYQNELVTDIHRLVVLADLIVIVFVWRQIAIGSAALPWPTWAKRGAAVSGATLSLFAAVGALTFPGEYLDKSPWARIFHKVAILKISDSQEMFSIRKDTIEHGEWLKKVPSARRLVVGTLKLRGFDPVDNEKFEKMKARSIVYKSAQWQGERTIVIRPRNFFAADFAFADLRKSDLRDSNFSQAFFFNTLLNGSVMDRTNLTHASMRGVKLEGANLFRINASHVDISYCKCNGLTARQACLKNSLMVAIQGERLDLKNATLVRSLNSPEFSRHPRRSFCAAVRSRRVTASRS